MIKREIGKATLYCADCKDVLPLLKDINSCVTDPPYGLSFMGKGWDYDVPSQDIWSLVFDSLKQGSHLLSFFGSRTYHRGVIPIEDAGFEIRDQLMWLYGSGFPKSLNIGKAVDKFGGNNHLSKKIASELKKARTKRNITLKQADILFCYGSTNYSWYEGRPKGISIPDEKTFEKISDEWTELKEISQLVKQAERELVDVKDRGNGRQFADGKSGFSKGKTIYTKGNSEWEGWGTALKPAHEPIVMARKPIPKTIAENVLEHGTGGINIDECRVGNEQGRYPANVMHDGSEVVQDIFADKARYFYCPKASKKDRDEGLENFVEAQTTDGNIRSNSDTARVFGANSVLRKNIHPTVKPTDLMKYLCTLVTPKEGIVLDPFMGSGSTGKAALQKGFRFVGIEMNEEYFEIACSRIEAAQKGQGEMF